MNNQSVDKLGKAGETVKVAPGYFRNHLMPKLLAVPNIDKYAYLIREQRKVRSFLLSFSLPFNEFYYLLNRVAFPFQIPAPWNPIR